MDSYPTLIPITLVLKVSEDELKTELKTEYDVISGEDKAIKEIPDFECRIDLRRRIQNDEAGEEKEILAAYLALFDIKEKMEIRSNFIFCIESTGFLKYHDVFHTHENNSWGGTICTFADLFDPEKKFITNGEFVIEMKGIIFVRDKENQFIKPENCLTERLWKDEDECDFTIVAKEDDGYENEIMIHKLALALRSPVFQRMFKTDMKEKQEGKVEIIDFDFDTVETAVEFCYDQEIFNKSRGWRQLINLQKFADKYDIQDLKLQTEIYMVEKISLENICKITNAVINLNASKLQEFCFGFLMMSSKEEIPIKYIDKLNHEIATDLFKNSMVVENC